MIKSALRKLVPSVALGKLHRVRLLAIRRRFNGLAREEAFSAIYRGRHWGRENTAPFFSGEGSTEQFTPAYCEAVAHYVRTHSISSIVDLGCGDFQVGSKISKLTPAYCGVDIVRSLIEYNQVHYGSQQARFDCLDIVEDPLPPGQLCLIRQVFQHLSNAEIQAVLAKIKMYEHVIVTEHVPIGTVRFPNVDKPHGPDTRLSDESGVLLAEPPFLCKVNQFWEFPYDQRSKFQVAVLAQ
jgi:SAM-dependent methyltransferase